MRYYLQGYIYKEARVLPPPDPDNPDCPHKPGVAWRWLTGQTAAEEKARKAEGKRQDGDVEIDDKIYTIGGATVGGGVGAWADDKNRLRGLIIGALLGGAGGFSLGRFSESMRGTLGKGTLGKGNPEKGNPEKGNPEKGNPETESNRYPGFPWLDSYKSTNPYNWSLW